MYHSIYIRLNVCTFSTFVLKYHLLIIEKKKCINILDLFSSWILHIKAAICGNIKISISRRYIE